MKKNMSCSENQGRANTGIGKQVDPEGEELRMGLEGIGVPARKVFSATSQPEGCSHNLGATQSLKFPNYGSV